MRNPSSSVTDGKKIRIISQVLTTAIKLWLKTQLSQVSQLEVEISASDRQILSGNIPSVSIFAADAIYQGIHVTRIQLKAENIQINIGSVLKGQPLRLLEIVPVVAELTVAEQDLNDSLSSELLSTTLNDLLVKLLPEQCQNSKPISWQEITLDNQRLILTGLLGLETKPMLLEMCVGLELLNGQELQLTEIKIEHNQEVLLESNSGYNFYLGSDVDIQEVTVVPSQLLCRGRINVNP
jgi:LmeA-like phospholipid-binding